MCGTNVPYFKLLSHACGTDDLFLWRCDPFLRWYSTHMVQTTLILRCCPTYVVQMTHIIMCCSCTCSLDDPYFNVLPTHVVQITHILLCCPIHVVQMTHILLCCPIHVLQMAHITGVRMMQEERVEGIRKELLEELYKDAAERHKTMLVTLKVCLCRCRWVVVGVGAWWWV